MNYDATQQFIEEHSADDASLLALRGCARLDVDFPFALQQIAGRQKIKRKLPELYATQGVRYPDSLPLEQCSSQACARYKSQLAQGDSLIDCTAGFGVDAMAFAQKTERQVYAVERNRELCQILEHNIRILQMDNIEVICQNAEDFLASHSPADTVYIDPARRDKYGKKIVNLAEYEPNIIAIKRLLLSKCRELVMIKLSPMLDLKAALRQLPETVEIHILSVDNECKETLFLLHPHAQGISPTVVAANITERQIDSFRYSFEEETNAALSICDETQAYLYAPNASLMKSGVYKLIGVRYGIQALHPQTHLYTSSHFIADFQGQIHKALLVIPFNKTGIKSVRQHVSQANVAVRNFPLSAEALKKRLGIKDGGALFLFGVTLQGDRKALILTERAN